MSEPVTVVAIGASAGGLSPIEEFFDALPPNTGAAYVVIQHLSPDHESMMAPLLNSHTDMEVAQAAHGVPIQANRVYLIPPGTELAIDERRFVVTARRDDRGTVPKPIDIFFSSLAKGFTTNAVAIVLSGTGSDGTLGVERVRRAGGLTLAQDASAAFEGMPTAAQQSGFIDAVMPPNELALAVRAFIDDAARPGADVGERSLDAAENRVLSTLSTATGIAFNEYKPATIHRRLARRMTLSGHQDMDSYAAFIRDSHAERLELVDDLLIDVTQFFRDSKAFEVIETDVAPRLVQEAADADRPLRLWISACSTGAEAYSIVIVFMEAAARLGERAPQIQAFATDVHAGVIETAGAGKYTEEQMAGVSMDRRHNFFEQTNDVWHVRPRLRAAITFATHNLLNDAPFTKIDFASCRNLLIYFRTSAQERAIGSLGFALRFGGVLFLGSSETLGFAEPDYSTINSTWRVFRKESDVAERAHRRIPSPSSSQVALRTPIVAADHNLLRSYDAVLESQFSAGLLVSQRRELVHVLGSGGEWLTQPSGRPTLDVLSMVRDPHHRLTIGAALRELEGGATEATARPLGVPQGGDDTFEVLLGRRIELGSGRFMILLYSRRAEQPIQMATPTLAGGEPQLDLDHLGHLEAELVYTRESLQSALEEQETSNEELNAANEELIASNEELQSTNEELSSVNEELRTLNDEHQRRLDQVLDLTADLEQLMSATDIGVVFLAEDGTIRRFNEPARDFFRVRDHDIGRPFEDVRTVLDSPQLTADVNQAFTSGDHAARSMITDETDHRRLIVRVSPYQLPRERSGVLVAVVDITDVTTADEERLLAQFLKSSPMGTAIFDSAGRFMHRLRPFIVNGTEIDVIGKRPADVHLPEVAMMMNDVREDVLRTGQNVLRLSEPVQHPDGRGWSKLALQYAFPMEVDGETYVGGMTIDASEFGPLLELRRDHSFVSGLLNSLNGTLVAVDSIDNVVQMTGVHADDIPSSIESGFGAWLQLDRDIHRSCLEKTRDGEVAAAEAKAVTAQGLRWHLLRYIPMSTSHDDHTTTVLITDSHDQITARRANIDRIAELEQKLRDLQQSTAADVASLAERNEDLDNFAHVAAHDLKAPIRSIRSFSEMALPDLDPASEAYAHVTQVIASSKRMSALVQSLLEFAAIGRGSAQLESVNINDLLDDVQLDLRTELTESGAEVVIDTQHGTIEGDPDGVRQVLTNLIHNAVKFAGDDPRIMVESEESEGGVLIRVTDNGIGFDTNQSDRLFEPFQRLHATETPGSGVGLAICRRIVQRHFGRIWASSEEGIGSQFTIWLPLGETRRAIERSFENSAGQEMT